MRPLLLNTYHQTGGAARAALRLHQGLRRIGVDSRLLVRFRGGAEEGVLDVSTAALRPLGRLRARLDRLPLLPYRRRAPGLFTPAVVPDRLSRRVRALAPDLVHLHWVADGFMRLESLRRLGRPLVWTLHDSWAFTGGCHVPGECTRHHATCGCCPALGSRHDGDLSRRVWARKRRAWESLPITVVAPSRWLSGCARSSALLGAARNEVIPNGLDLERFQPADRAASRMRWRMPADRKLVLFGGVHSATDPNKGLALMVEALHHLAARGLTTGVDWVVFGTTPGEPLPDVPCPVRVVGNVADEAALAALYAAADVFVAPSIQENLPNTVMEALACGTPCVAFDAGGLPDLIEHRRNGWLARAHQAEDLARGMAWVLEDETRRRALAARGRRKAEEEFELSRVARRYADLYRDLMDRVGTA
jgi:glycosyltransferase involved in cell wall biosynthesis